jgi:hypothetical protein
LRSKWLDRDNWGWFAKVNGRSCGWFEIKRVIRLTEDRIVIDFDCIDKVVILD